MDWVLGPLGVPLDIIRLRGITARGRHGVLPEERVDGQVFIADLSLHLDAGPAAIADSVTRTVNYAEVARVTTEILSGEPVDLIETLASRVAQAVLELDLVRVADVTIHKPNAPIGVPCEDVSVTVRRSLQETDYTFVAPDSAMFEAVGEAERRADLDEEERREPLSVSGSLMPPPVSDALGRPVEARSAAALLPSHQVSEDEAVRSARPGKHSSGRRRRHDADAVAAVDLTPEEPVDAIVALGANLGEALSTLRSALDDLRDEPGIEVAAVSPLARTAPVGRPDQPDFFNAVAHIRTTLSPRTLLHTLQGIEEKHGRQRTGRWAPRTLDLDLIAYDTLLADEDELTIPHPRAHERAFVLVPWSLMSPKAFLPGLGGGPVATLAESAPDKGCIRWLAPDWDRPAQGRGPGGSGGPDMVAAPEAVAESTARPMLHEVDHAALIGEDGGADGSVRTANGSYDSDERTGPFGWDEPSGGPAPAFGTYAPPRELPALPAPLAARPAGRAPGQSWSPSGLAGGDGPGTDPGLSSSVPVGASTPPPLMGGRPAGGPAVDERLPAPLPPRIPPGRSRPRGPAGQSSRPDSGAPSQSVAGPSPASVAVAEPLPDPLPAALPRTAFTSRMPGIPSFFAAARQANQAGDSVVIESAEASSGGELESAAPAAFSSAFSSMAGFESYAAAHQGPSVFGRLELAQVPSTAQSSSRNEVEAPYPSQDAGEAFAPMFAAEGSAAMPARQPQPLPPPAAPVASPDFIQAAPAAATGEEPGAVLAGNGAPAAQSGFSAPLVPLMATAPPAPSFDQGPSPVQPVAAQPEAAAPGMGQPAAAPAGSAQGGVAAPNFDAPGVPGGLTARAAPGPMSFGPPAQAVAPGMADSPAESEARPAFRPIPGVQAAVPPAPELVSGAAFEVETRAPVPAYQSGAQPAPEIQPVSLLDPPAPRGPVRTSLAERGNPGGPSLGTAAYWMTPPNSDR
jgi:dihydroneopterin aldolase/2-amino-4-hydroxy-6-hydroxymethyldihydropteridine diphosphokinase